MFLKPKIVNSIVKMTYGGIPDPPLYSQCVWLKVNVYHPDQ